MAKSTRNLSIESPNISAVSWAAILAGGFTATALTIVLIVFGTAIGLASVSPWSNAGISTTTFKVTAGLYLVVVAMLSSTVGGYMAGRLRTKWIGAHNEEVLFRDTAHGFLAWAFATVAGVLVLGTATTPLIGGVSSGLGPSAARANQSSSAPTDYFVDTLLRSSAGSPATANAQNDFAARREVTLIVTRGLSQPDGIPAADRSYLAQTVAARTGLTPADADKRVNDVIAQAKSYLDEVRKFTSALALWLTLSLFLGAFSASAAAIEGGQLRDGRWRGIFARGTYR